MFYYVYFIFSLLDITFSSYSVILYNDGIDRVTVVYVLLATSRSVQYNTRKCSTTDYYSCCSPRTALYISCWITKYVTFNRSSSHIPFCNNLDNFVGQKNPIILILSCRGGGYFSQNVMLCAFKECFWENSPLPPLIRTNICKEM